MKTTIALASLALIGSLAACDNARPLQPTYEEDLAAITAFNKRYLGSINDEDIKTLSSLTTDGHVMLMPGREPLVGKTANDEANGRAFEQFDFAEEWHPIETVISGDLGFQRGTYTTTATPRAGGDARSISGNFLRIYQRQSNGEWRMTRDTFNSVPAATN